MLYKRNRRRGVVAPFVAICLVAIVSVAAIALDGGLILDQSRRTHAAADAAALAAAADLFSNYPANNGYDYGTAKQSVLTTAAANGYNNDGVTNIVTVTLYPNNYLGGPNVGTQIPPGYAEVIIQYNLTRGFSSIFGTGDIPVISRAVARGQWVPYANGIIVLDPSVKSALNANGNGTVTVKGANIIVDSNNSYAATTVGNAVVTDVGKNVIITGKNPGYSGNFIDSATLTGQRPTPDPLAYLPVPNPNSMTTRSLTGGSNSQAQPGYYPSGIHISGQTNLTMAPGIYYINGTFDFSGQGSLSAQGVMIYATGGASVTGLGGVTWSPPTSGIYTGISYFQDRTSTASAKVAGNGLFNVTGTFYLAKGLADMQGNGDASIASQVVTGTMTAGGNGATNIIWNGPPTSRMRIIQLVE